MNKIPVPAKYFPAILFTIVFAAGLLGINYLNSFSSNNVLSHEPVNVTTAQVSLINKPVEIILPGTIQSRQAIIISAEIPGRISELHATEGAMVKAGQLLVHIDGSGEQVIIETPSKQNGDSSSQANFDKLVKEYERYQKLYQVGGIARKQFEDISARFQAAREALQNGSDTMSSTQARQAGSANLTAPISGKVTGLSAVVGKTVQPGQQLMILDTGGDVRAIVHLEQKDLYLVQAGTLAEIIVEGSGNQSLTGQVEAIYPETGTSTPLFLTHIRVDNANNLLKPEMTATVHLKTSQSTLVCAVPRSAVLQNQESNYLYLVLDGKVAKQQVNVGAVIGDLVEITTRLPEQATIITSGMNKLTEGDVLALP